MTARNKKDIYLCSYFMPHRNLNDITRLDKSLKQVTNHKKGKHIILAGDFNCPDINWEKMTVNKGAADREVQQSLLDLTTEHGLSQIHDQPTRDNNLLDLVFTNNPSVVKSSTSVPEISDHAMVVLFHSISSRSPANCTSPKPTGTTSMMIWTFSPVRLLVLLPLLQQLKTYDVPLRHAMNSP